MFNEYLQLKGKDFYPDFMIYEDEDEQKVLCFNHEKGTITDQVDGIDITRVNCQAKVASQSIAMSYGKELKKIMKSFDPEIVIFHYPNPFVAHYLMKHLKNKKFKFIVDVYADLEGNSEVSDVEIFDLQGRLMAMYPLKKGVNQIDVSGLSEGLYFIKTAEGAVGKVMVRKYLFMKRRMKRMKQII